MVKNSNPQEIVNDNLNQVNKLPSVPNAKIVTVKAQSHEKKGMGKVHPKIR